jgi:hypothetical protein
LRKRGLSGICPGSDQEGTTMDYGKSGNPKGGKHEPKNKEGRSKTLAEANEEARKAKAELLARMKAAAEAKKPS